MSTSGQVGEWDPSWPGTGAQRCTTITQLYFRMANYPSLTILVVDALCLVFNEGGATQSELEAYLGLSDERIRYAIACIPDGMRCTSKDLADTDNAVAVAKRAEEEAEVVHFLNYRRLLPIAYAHITRLLLSLCRTPLPTNGPSASSSTSTAATTPLNLSRRLILDKACEGIMCRACRFYHSMADFEGGLALCPTCGDDVVSSTLKLIKEKMDARCSQGKLLVSLPPGSAAAAAARAYAGASSISPAAVDGSPTAPASGTSHAEVASPVGGEPANSAVPSAKEARVEYGTDCALARDPFLVQQALVFFHLFADRLAFVAGDGALVSPDDILTEAEYHRRLQGRASVADLFRATHRNPASIHVKVVSQKEMDDMRTAENERKLAKRAHLPPWLRHRSAASLLGPNMLDDRGGEPQSTAEDANDDSAEPLANSTEDRSAASLRAARSAKRARSDHNSTADSTAAANSDNVTAVAAFVAKRFFYDEFEPVPLPRRRRA